MIIMRLLGPSKVKVQRKSLARRTPARKRTGAESENTSCYLSYTGASATLSRFDGSNHLRNRFCARKIL
jgi:hypothetical protein